MDDLSNEQRPRASLRGKGRRILLGEDLDAADVRQDAASAGEAEEEQAEVDASSLALTPEETEALLDFSALAPAYEAPQVDQAAEQDTFPGDDVLDWATPDEMVEEVPPPVKAYEEAPAPTASDALPLGEQGPARTQDYAPRPEVEALVPDTPERLPGRDAPSGALDEVDEADEAELDDDAGALPLEPYDSPPEDAADATPLGEQSPEMVGALLADVYQPKPEVEALVPAQPEMLADDDTAGEPLAKLPDTLTGHLLQTAPTGQDVAAEEDEYAESGYDQDDVWGDEEYGINEAEWLVEDAGPVPDWLSDAPLTALKQAVEAADTLPMPDSEPYAPPPPNTNAAIPLGEQPPDVLAQRLLDRYQPRPEVEALVPRAPETIAARDEAAYAAADEVVEEEAAPYPAYDETAYDMGEIEAALAPEADEDVFDFEPDARAYDFADHEGGLMAPQPPLDIRPPEITDPFEGQVRPPASQLFEDTSPPDETLLSVLVDDERLQRLWNQIEALQETLIDDVPGDRDMLDTYHQELLQASSLLLESRANYDDARAIVYRVRADMNRQHKVNDYIRRYRPLLLNYYLGWGIGLVVLMLLKGLFTGMAEAVGVELLSALYYPMLAGILGALISGYLTLDRHTTRLRDFDPIHISWYLFNPLLGGVMGLLMYLLASIANASLLDETASNTEVAIVWLLCVVAGMNQNSVLRQLNDFVRQFGRGQKDDSDD